MAGENGKGAPTAAAAAAASSHIPHPNALDSQTYGGSSHPFAFPSQPPDIRNWFSNYEYESPDSSCLSGYLGSYLLPQAESSRNRESEGSCYAKDMNLASSPEKSCLRVDFQVPKEKRYLLEKYIGSNALEDTGINCDISSTNKDPFRDDEQFSISLPVGNSCQEHHLIEEDSKRVHAIHSSTNISEEVSVPRLHIKMNCSNIAMKNKDASKNIRTTSSARNCEGDVGETCPLPLGVKDHELEKPSDPEQELKGEVCSKFNEDGGDIILPRQEGSLESSKWKGPMDVEDRKSLEAETKPNVSDEAETFESAKENNEANGFVSTRNCRNSMAEAREFHCKLTCEITGWNQGIQGKSSERVQSGKRSALRDRSNLSSGTQVIAETEIPGKWKCPRKNKPYSEPLMKQRRLERWIHRVN